MKKNVCNKRFLLANALLSSTNIELDKKPYDFFNSLKSQI